MIPVDKGPLAQLAEQQTLNLRVLGSIPRRLTTPFRPYVILPSAVEGEPRPHAGDPGRGGLPEDLTAKVAELVYALDLGSSPERSGWGFESPLSHQIQSQIRG